MRETPNGPRLSSFSGGRCMALYINNNPRPYLVDGPSVSRSSLFRERSRAVGGFRPDLAMDGNSEAILNFLGPDIRAVEVYRDFWEIPDELKTAARIEALWPENRPVPCGMALIWTRAAW